MSRSWVKLPSGCRLDLINPTPFDWSDEDLAIRMARVKRWSGESRWPDLSLSVAQHALLVLTLRRQWATTPLSPVEESRELHHDDDEGLLGFDCSTPLKPILGAPFKAVTGRLQQVVFIRYALPMWTPEEKSIHKRADRVAAACEALHVVGWSRSEIRTILEIPYEPLENDPLVEVYGGEPWKPWPQEVATERYLAEMRAIESKRKAQEKAVQSPALPQAQATLPLFL